MCKCRARLMFGLSLSPRLAWSFDEALADMALAAGVSKSWVDQGALVFRDRLRMPGLEMRGCDEWSGESSDADVEWIEPGNDSPSDYLLGFVVGEGSPDGMFELSKDFEVPKELEALWQSKVSPVLASFGWDFWGPGLRVVEY